MIVTLLQRIGQLIDQHGGLRAAARAVRLDAGYLLRLKSSVSEPAAGGVMPERLTYVDQNHDRRLSFRLEFLRFRRTSFER
jgi:hypothetical protein